MSLPLIISARTVTALCLECNRPYTTEEVTDSQGVYLRNGNICWECVEEAHNYFENNAFDWSNDR